MARRSGSGLRRRTTSSSSSGLSARKATGSPWGYASTYDLIVEKLLARPVYRVVEEITNHFRDGSDQHIEEKVWEGQDLMELSAKFPKRDTPGAWHRGGDTLGYSSIEDGYIVTSHRFEVLKEGEWVKVKDPRVFDCCVPRDVFERHSRGNRSGWQQTRRCYHDRTGRSIHR